MILKNNEKLMSLVDAYEAVTGTRPSLSVPWRHSQYGLGGVRLEFVSVGAKRMTSIESVIRFFEARTAMRLPKAATKNSQSHQQADAEIDRLTKSTKKGRKKKVVAA